MASLRKKLNSCKKVIGYELRFYTLDNVPRSIWLRGYSGRMAQDFKRHVAELLRAKKGNVQPDSHAASWLDGLEGSYRDKLVSFGLASPLNSKAFGPEDRKLKGFLGRYVADMPAATDRTKNNYQQAANWLTKYLGDDTDLASITRADLSNWQKELKAAKLALSTRNKHVQRCKTMFRYAVDSRIIRESPACALKEEKQPTRVDRSKQQFVNRELSTRVLDGLPNVQWRLIFSLLRFQGFRRHEVFGLEWSHIDWASSRMQLHHSLKTGYRECPIFPETLPYLREAFEQAPAGATKVIQWAGSEDSLTTLLRKRILAIVGPEAWPKACQQLRSTRRTELDERFPAYVIDDWLGHDERVARQHYSQITPEHWADATRPTMDLSHTGSHVPISAERNSPENTVANTLGIAYSPVVIHVPEYPRQDLNSVDSSQGKTQKRSKRSHAYSHIPSEMAYEDCDSEAVELAERRSQECSKWLGKLSESSYRGLVSLLAEQATLDGISNIHSEATELPPSDVVQSVGQRLAKYFNVATDEA